MACSKDKGQLQAAESSEKCDFCEDDGLAVNATTFCRKCWKFLCSTCMISHEKFLPGHKLSQGANMPRKDELQLHLRCEMHTGFVVDLFCEEHLAVFCRYCKPLKHKDCEVQAVCDVIGELNVKEEMASVLTGLSELTQVFAKQEAKSRNKLTNYSKAKSAIETKIKRLKTEIVKILNSYDSFLDDQQQSDIDSLNAKLESYRSLQENVKDTITSVKDEKYENDMQSFLSLVEMKRQYKTFRDYHDVLQKDKDAIGFFILKDERLPALIQELSDITGLEHVTENNNDGKDKSYPSTLSRSQACQTDTKLFNNLQLTKKDQACRLDKFEVEVSENTDDNLTDDDIEYGSSEEAMEKSFWNIKSCSCLKEASISDHINIADGCFMSNNIAVLCEIEYGHLKLFDTVNMKVVLELRPRNPEHKPNHIAAVDGETAVVSMDTAKLLQFIAVIPAIKFGQEIVLKCKCDGITVYGKEIYVYSQCLDETSCFRYQGCHIYSLKGEMLKIIPLFDDIQCFSLNKEGHIMYFGSRRINSCNELFLKTVTKEGIPVSQTSYTENSNAIYADDDGNFLVCETASGNICVMKGDGTHRRLILNRDPNFCKLTTMCFSRHDSILLVVGRASNRSSMTKVKMYKLEF